MNELKLCGPEGQELLRIRQKSLARGFTYEFFRGEKQVGSLRKKVFSFRPRYELESLDGPQIRITGSFRQYEWDFECEGAIVARLGKKPWALADTYGIEIDDSVDQQLALAAVIAINAIVRSERQAEAARLGKPPGSVRG